MRLTPRRLDYAADTLLSSTSNWTLKVCPECGLWLCVRPHVFTAGGDIVWLMFECSHVGALGYSQTRLMGTVEACEVFNALSTQERREAWARLVAVGMEGSV